MPSTDPKDYSDHIKTISVTEGNVGPEVGSTEMAFEQAIAGFAPTDPTRTVVIKMRELWFSVGPGRDGAPFATFWRRPDGKPEFIMTPVQEELFLACLNAVTGKTPKVVMPQFTTQDTPGQSG